MIAIVLRILFFVKFVLNKTQICSTPMINLQLISTFQHQLTTVNAGANQLVLRYIQELLGHGNLKNN